MGDKETAVAFGELTGERVPQEKPTIVQLGVRHTKSTKTLLDEITYLHEYILDRGTPYSSGDIVRMGLDLLAEKIDYPKLSKKYRDELDKLDRKPGRIKGR